MRIGAFFILAFLVSVTAWADEISSNTAKVTSEKKTKAPSGYFDPVIDATNAQAVLAEATTRVKAIINKPVRSFPRTAGMGVWVSKPGWFHPGASRPDFDHVDVRASRELAYANNQYVSSDVTPGLVFLGAELEFNSMTKYFYENHNLPKAKLSEKEMEEINRLYRIIGKCEALLHPPPKIVAETADDTPEVAEAKPALFTPQGLAPHKQTIIFTASAALIVLLFLRFVLKSRST